MAAPPLPLPPPWSKRKLPMSCIESTCHAIQCLNGGWTTWKSTDTTTNGAGVWAAFGNKLICVNHATDLVGDLTGVTDFNLAYLGVASMAAAMRPGRGIILANSTPGDQAFNMHLGANIMMNGLDFIFTDMSDTGNVVNSNIEAIVLRSNNIVSDFRGPVYANAGVFKFGLLICESDGDFAGLRGHYGPAQIFDDGP